MEKEICLVYTFVHIINFNRNKNYLASIITIFKIKCMTDCDLLTVLKTKLTIYIYLSRYDSITT